MLLLGFLEVA